MFWISLTSTPASTTIFSVEYLPFHWLYVCMYVYTVFASKGSIWFAWIDKILRKYHEVYETHCNATISKSHRMHGCWWFWDIALLVFTCKPFTHADWKGKLKLWFIDVRMLSFLSHVEDALCGRIPVFASKGSIWFAWIDKILRKYHEVYETHCNANT